MSDAARAVHLPNAALLAKAIRAASRHGIERMPEEAFAFVGAGMLRITAGGTLKSILLMAERAGAPHDGLVPVRFWPTSRAQAAELYLLTEQLEGPESTHVREEGRRTEPAPPSPSSYPGEDTLVESLDDGAFDQTALFLPEERPTGVDHPITSTPPLVAPRSSAVVRCNLPQDPLAGMRIGGGRYELNACLGSGGAGKVYRAMHLDLGREVAVKVLHAENQDDTNFVHRFKMEARAASLLDHQNVTRVLDFGQDQDGLLYLVMEYVPGRTLESVIRSEGRLSVLRVVEIGTQVAAALALAHEAGIIHRDIKPENILLVPAVDDDGAAIDLVKVCDFGMAKLKNAGLEDEPTNIGLICGSPAYMSPEQIRGSALDARSDIYALGLSLYEAVTGAHPFTSDTLFELFRKHEIEDPRRPSELVPDLDPAFEEMLLRMLAKEPELRHPTARHVRADLRAMLDGLRAAESSSSFARR